MHHSFIKYSPHSGFINYSTKEKNKSVNCAVECPTLVYFLLLDFCKFAEFPCIRGVGGGVGGSVTLTM